MTWRCPIGRWLSRVSMTGPRRAARGRLVQSYSLILGTGAREQSGAPQLASRLGCPRAHPGGDGPFATEAHPFSALLDLDNFRKRIGAYQGHPDETILRERRRALDYWKARTQALRSKSLSRLFGSHRLRR